VLDTDARSDVERLNRMVRIQREREDLGAQGAQAGGCASAPVLRAAATRSM
jgi:hypothetical protein